jgi:hypothetical protein
MWADIEARKWTEEGLEDTLTDHDKLERVAKVIVSPQCFSQWDDYLADLILAKYNLHPTIDDVRVGYMQRDALLLVDYVEHVFARKFETLLLERNVPTA